ncbi:MAG TPA: bifunctional 3'-5' exonuclease/DNA polymerase [Streptosporangiaceae bacterium]|nr:bifunctional 3'-5' exonuclease/DNA polymerase [Streptosporangiaceae bacterium]
MRIAVVPGRVGSGLLGRLEADDTLAAEPEPVADLPAAIAEHERTTPGVRWVWRSTRSVYPGLLRSGVRAGRCHDAELTAALLVARDGVAGQPDWPGAQHRDADETAAQTAQLPFDADDSERHDPRDDLAALVAVHREQQARIRADDEPAKFALLAAAESAGGIVAAEMTAAGLPWRADIHDRLLTEVLGPRPPVTGGLLQRPARLADLAAQISAALGAVRPVNPDSPAQLLRALAASGIRVSSTRSAVLRQVDHPVIPLLLEYKELARLYTANGWSWLDTWVSAGRFRPEYVVGGVVSGRWASRGGGALQIPKLLRQAVVADPGWTLIVADAAQLEPRILAALAGDRAFAQAAGSGDLYDAVAAAIGGDRATAKLALLSAMYGGTGGDGGQSLALLRRRFPQASAFVESAARAGEEGRVVRSVLGRTCPAPSAEWRSLTSESGDPDQERDPSAGAAARARGRFTRNFVVQASAADWALVLLALLRSRLAAPAQLVFFQHDEVIVHCPAAQAGEVAAAIDSAAAGATQLVFGATDVSFPMTTVMADCYSDAK